MALINEYGPTETVVSCTAHRVRELPAADAPIGRPQPGATVHVLDDSLRPVSPGTVGELYVGGSFPATGYAAQPARTAERFVADPYGAGARLYRTGDLVRLDSAGELEFHGRADDQVKVRGHRVELGEVAQVLRRHPGVAQAEVLPLDVGGEAQLAAFLVGADANGASGSMPDAAELRAFCRRQLVEPAVPAQYVPVAAMPINHVGKVDRAALVDRLAEHGTAPVDEFDESAVRHWSPTQRAVWRAWSRVLGHGDAGLRDSFFDQGGTSLKLIDLHKHLDQQWPGAVRVGELFDLSTIEGQAQALHARSGQETTPAPRRRPVASFEL